MKPRRPWNAVMVFYLDNRKVNRQAGERRAVCFSYSIGYAGGR